MWTLLFGLLRPLLAPLLRLVGYGAAAAGGAAYGAQRARAKQAERDREVKAQVDKATAAAPSDKAELERRLGKPGARL